MAVLHRGKMICSRIGLKSIIRLTWIRQATWEQCPHKSTVKCIHMRRFLFQNRWKYANIHEAEGRIPHLRWLSRGHEALLRSGASILPDREQRIRSRGCEHNQSRKSCRNHSNGVVFKCNLSLLSRTDEERDWSRHVPEMPWISLNICMKRCVCDWWKLTTEFSATEVWFQERQKAVRMSLSPGAIGSWWCRRWHIWQAPWVDLNIPKLCPLKITWYIMM